VPRKNSLLFFEVSDRSFHQVSEIFSQNKTRLSINGWFHGPINYRPEPYIEIFPEPSPYIDVEVV
jgi:Rps23 Pro-64 3,4-dihydroxylase Tpa1-like proline 4-hydroxylase